MLTKQAFNNNRSKSPSKPASIAGWGTLGTAYSKFAERYPFAPPTPLLKCSNEKRNAKAARSPIETLTISPEFKIAYDSSRSMPSAKCLESVIRQCFTLSLDIWRDKMTNLFAVTRSNGWFPTSAEDPFNIMEDLLLLRLPFFLRPPSHNTPDEKLPKHVHTCAEFCKRLVDALHHTHSRGTQSRGLVCSRSFDDAGTPETPFPTDTRPFVQTPKRFTCGVHVLHGVSPTRVVDGQLITCDQTKNTWILLELNYSFHPREECAYHMYDFPPRSVARMLSETEPSPARKCIGFLQC